MAGEEVVGFMNAAPNVQKASDAAMYSGIDRMQDIQKKYYDNKKLAAVLPFVEPRERAATQKDQADAEYEAQVKQADIGKAQAEAAQRNQLSQMTQAEIKNLPPETAAKLLNAMPPGQKQAFAAQYSNDMIADPKLAGSLAQGFDPSAQSAPISAPQSSPQASGMTRADVAALQKVTPSSQMSAPTDLGGQASGMTGGTRQQGLPSVSTLPPAPVQGQQTAAPQGNTQLKSSGLGLDTAQAKHDAALAGNQAIGDPAARNAFIEKIPSYKNIQTINDTILNNPGAITRYAGYKGGLQYQKDAIEGKLMRGSQQEADFLAMQRIKDTYSVLAADQLTKLLTNSGTKHNINTTKAAMQKAFSPGATETQTLNAMTDLANMQAMHIQEQARQGNQDAIFTELTGAQDIKRNFVKNPIVPDMTPDQAHKFLSSMSKADREKYKQGYYEMVQRQAANEAKQKQVNAMATQQAVVPQQGA